MRIEDLKEGMRIRLTNDVERFPHFIAPKGATGTVMPIHEGDGCVLIQMDGSIPGMEDWDNQLQIVPEYDDGDSLEQIEETGT